MQQIAAGDHGNENAKEVMVEFYNGSVLGNGLSQQKPGFSFSSAGGDKLWKGLFCAGQ